MLKSFYVGVKGVIRVEDKVLLLKKRNKEGNLFWDIPGGRIDDNETISKTLHRELKEEVPTLNNFKQGKILSAYRLPNNLEDGLGLLLLFYKIEAEPFSVTLSDEHEAFIWVSTDTIEDIKRDQGIYTAPGYLEAIVQALQ